MALLFGLSAGVMVGALVGMVGAGGSLLTIPLLISWMHMSLRMASATEQVIVLLSSLVALLPRWRQVDWRVAALMAGVGAPFTRLGSVLGRHVGESTLRICFAVVMAIAAMLLVRRSSTDRANINHANESRVRYMRSTASGAGVGMLAGVFGIGGGFLLVPTMSLVLRLKTAAAVGTTLVVVVIDSTVGIAGRLVDGMVPPWSLTTVLAIGAMLASLSVSRFAMRLPERLLQCSLAVLIAIMAVYMTVSGVSAGSRW